MKRDLQTWIETNKQSAGATTLRLLKGTLIYIHIFMCTQQQRFVYQKRPTNMHRDLIIYERDLQYEKRPPNMKRDQHTERGSNDALLKGTYIYEKKPINMCKKRPNVYMKRVNIYMKRGLYE